jgi:BirA family biotin operon repressor/biotin-[acetyl-CoA-carboxylase] ligase
VTSDGRKLGGVLVETAVEGERLSRAVVGIGLNVNWRTADMPAELEGTASSLSEIAGGPLDRTRLLRRLLEELERELTAVEAGVAPLERYRRACRTLGSAVEVDAGGRILHGRAVDVDASGALIVLTDDGPVPVSSGEVVSARPAVTA